MSFTVRTFHTRNGNYALDLPMHMGVSGDPDTRTSRYVFDLKPLRPDEIKTEYMRESDVVATFDMNDDTVDWIAWPRPGGETEKKHINDVTTKYKSIFAKPVEGELSCLLEDGRSTVYRATSSGRQRLAVYAPELEPGSIFFYDHGDLTEKLKRQIRSIFADKIELGPDLQEYSCSVPSIIDTDRSARDSARKIRYLEDTNHNFCH